MKTNNLLKTGIILTMLFCLNSNGQSLKYAIGTGLNFCNVISVSNSSRVLNLPLLTTGINLQIKKEGNKKFDLRIEPGYMMKGGASYFDDIRYNHLLHYLQLPVLIDYNLNEKLFLSSGLEFAYLLNAKKYYNDDGTPFNRSFELSLLLEFGYRLSDKFDLGVRYGHGLTPFNTGTLQDDWKFYNHYLSFNIRYKLKTGANKK
jgi:hypothetical protein